MNKSIVQEGDGVKGKKKSSSDRESELTEEREI
jgi:hypothetical protein